MRVSTKGRYGLRVLMDIALHESSGPVALRDISRRQEISQKYLWQVIHPLKAAGLLRATRGARGGYALERPPATITLLDVVNILEGSLAVVACVTAPETCDRSGACVAREAWDEVFQQLSRTLDGITLQSLIDRQKDRVQRASPSYVI